MDSIVSIVVVVVVVARNMPWVGTKSSSPSWVRLGHLSCSISAVSRCGLWGTILGRDN